MSNILTTITSEAPKTTLWHYTNQKGLLGIISNKAIWATHHQYLNDRAEFTHAQNLLYEEIAMKLAISGLSNDDLQEDCLEKLKKHARLPYHGSFIFVCSLSERKNDLSQWRAYSRNQPGIAIGFSPEVLSMLAKKAGWSLLRCVYKDAEQKEIVKAIVDELINEVHEEFRPTKHINSEKWELSTIFDKLGQYLSRYASLLKHEAFAGEAEWRMISPVTSYAHSSLKFREGKSTLIPYQDLSLTDEAGVLRLERIVIGPTPDPEESRRSIISLLESRGVLHHDRSTVDVGYSNIPFRDW